MTVVHCENIQLNASIPFNQLGETIARLMLTFVPDICLHLPPLMINVDVHKPIHALVKCGDMIF